MVVLAAATAGCTRNDPKTGPGPVSLGPVGVEVLADELGMRLVNSGKYTACLTNCSNSMLVLGPPRAGVILNGRRLEADGEVAESGGRLVVKRALADRIRWSLRGVPVYQPPQTPDAGTWQTQPPPPGPKTASFGNKTVVLDPGHGGKDPGAPGRNGPEKIVNLDTALRVRNILNAKGIRTVMTRDDDSTVDREDRPVIANKAKADLFVSIHADSSQNGSANGAKVYVSRKASTASNELAKQMARSFGSNGITSRGVGEADYVVLVDTNMPAVLVEQGFLTNSGDMKKLASGAYRQRIAEAISQAIVAHLSGR